MKTFVPPFRLGRKTQRAILDSKGKELVVFKRGLEHYAEECCEFLNHQHQQRDMCKMDLDMSVGCSDRKCNECNYEKK
jgi:hypothetical protein